MTRTRPRSNKPNHESLGREGNERGRNQPVTPARLERWARVYLDRYSTSVANLRAVLRRRVVRQAEKSGQAKSAEARPWIEALLEQLREQGYLDDRSYARSLIRRLRARGASTQRARAQLLSKGIEAALAEELLPQLDDTADLAAACCYARRRRLGPFRADPAERIDRRQRDLAAFSRAGFSYTVASRIIDARDREALHSWLGTR